MEEKLWFTFKARIQAQIRLASNDFHSQALLVWYATVTAGLSIVTIRHPQLLGEDTDVLSAVAAVALLAISIFVTNQDFRGRSIAMRANYLALQALYDSIKIAGTTTASDVAKYAELLAASENHKEIDDKRFRVSHNGNLTSRMPTRLEYFDVLLARSVKSLMLVILYTAPISYLWFRCQR